MIYNFEINKALKKGLESLEEGLCPKVCELILALKEDCTNSKKEEVPLFDLLIHLIFLSEREMTSRSFKNLETKTDHDLENLVKFYSYHFLMDSFVNLRFKLLILL